MAQEKSMRLSQVAKILNTGISSVVNSLATQGFKIETNPNTKLNLEQLEVLAKEYKSTELLADREKPEPAIAAPIRQPEEEVVRYRRDEVKTPVVETTPAPAPTSQPTPADETLSRTELPGLKILGKIELNKPAAPAAKTPTPSPPAPKPAAEDVKPAPKPEPVAEATPVQEPPTPAASTAPAPKPELTVETNPIPQAVETEAEAPSDQTIRAAGTVTLQGLTIKGTVDLNQFTARTGSSPAERGDRKKRKRIQNFRENPSQRPSTSRPAPAESPNRAQVQSTDGEVKREAGGTTNRNDKNRPAGGGGRDKDRRSGRDRNKRETPSQADVRKSIQETNARLQGNTPNRGADRRRDRRNQREEDRRLQNEQEELEAKTLKVTEFVSANDLSSLMNVPINDVISVCMNLGMFVSINQRLDAEAITVIADEFGYDVQFVSAEDETEAGIPLDEDDPDDLKHRAPIVTIMGHVDHGKTSLLDYIRRTKVAAGEAGGITQHIGAYSVKTNDDRMITFLDTPGHEAFTAMRARGAKVTDVVIIVIAADDSVMPQTREAINHAQVAGVPIVFAFSKVDKPGADTDKIRTELSGMNMLVEEWGGKYQSQEISSKSGLGIDELLEKVLLEAELLDLKANPERAAVGTVIEASLDKGRGYVATVLVETGTLSQGDVMLVGSLYGRIRAMANDRGERIKEAGPSTPVQILGLPGAPQAGDKFNVMENEREAREIANKREQLLREQTLRTRKHITLEEIGRRKAIGTFKELNVIVKGDVDGSVEALSDALLQLSTEEVQVNIIHKAVGQISESDALLASASDAIIVGFQVRPSAGARKLVEQEQIELRLYSIIYDAINEIKDAMEGLLAPTVEEVVVGNIEVREVFKISKVGTVAGCYVTDGTIKRNNKIRIIRDFIVIHTGEISALKRFKEDVTEVKNGYECGLSIKNFNDIEVGDTIESFELREIKRTL